MKIELHTHTAESSPCSMIPAKELVRAYRDAGYGALVVTDHFSRDAFKSKNFSPAEKTDYFLRGYRIAREEGEKLGIKVFLGAELRFCVSNNNDYLCYGLTEEFFTEHPDLELMHQSEFLRGRPADCLVFQAHPFRNGITVTDSRRLDGMEVFNGHPGHNSRNEFALLWANHFHLVGISGSDAHYPKGMCRGGILTDRDICSMEELLPLLRAGDFVNFNKNLQPNRVSGS